MRNNCKFEHVQVPMVKQVAEPEEDFRMIPVVFPMDGPVMLPPTLPEPAAFDPVTLPLLDIPDKIPDHVSEIAACILYDKYVEALADIMLVCGWM